MALALVLLCGLSARGGWGCLQCDRSAQDALSQLRSALIPRRFHREPLQARAQALLLGMEGPFFRDYSLNAFVGKVGACGAGRKESGRPSAGGRWKPLRSLPKSGRTGPGRDQGGWGSTGHCKEPSGIFSPLLPGVYQLEGVAAFVRNQTKKIKADSLTGRACKSLSQLPLAPPPFPLEK